MGYINSGRAVLIFGGAGFVGSNWAHHLLANTAASVHVFDNLSRKNVERNLRWLQTCPGSHSRLRVTVGDIRDYGAVELAVFAANEIYHFAGQAAVTTSLEDPRTDFEINAGGTVNILEAARRSGNRPFLLFTSTSKVYGHIRPVHPARLPFDQKGDSGIGTVRESQPLDFYSPYGCSKGTADQYVHDYARIFGIPTVVFRMSSIAGPRQFGTEDQGWVAHFVYSALQSRVITIYGNGRQVRDVLAVSDLLRALSAAYEHREKTGGQVYNIGGGADNTVSLLGLIKLIERVLNVRLEYRFRQERPGDQPVYITNFGKFARHTSWIPEVSVEQTVCDIVRWYKNNEDLFLPEHFPVQANQVAGDVIREAASWR
jgi:CDP-paratose 2-epimerase